MVMSSSGKAKRKNPLKTQLLDTKIDTINTKDEGRKTLKPERDVTMKETTIHLFPVLDETNHSTTVFLSEEYYKMAKTLDFIPDSLETVKAIDRSELTLLMMVNDSFYNAVLILCGEIIDEMIKKAKKFAAEWFEEDPSDKEEYESIQGIVTFEDYFEKVYGSFKDPFILDLVGYLR